MTAYMTDRGANGASPFIRRSIIIGRKAWKWLKEDGRRPSRWIQNQVGMAMEAETSEQLREQNRELRGEVARLRDILNSLGEDSDGTRRKRRA